MESEDLAFKYPPDLNLCRIHRKANRMFRSLARLSSYERCQCCGRFVAEGSSAPSLCYNTEKEFQLLGPGIPLLFVFMRSMMLVLLLIVSVLGIYALVSNLTSDSCEKLSDPCSSDALNNLSISNKLLDSKLIAVQVQLVFALTIVWALLNQYVLYRCRKTEIRVDQYTRTPSDFSVLIRDLPGEADELQIRKMVLRKCKSLSESEKRETEDLRIERILIPRKQREYLERMRQQLDEFREWIERSEQGDFKVQEIKKGNERAQVAIVVFSRSSSKSFFLRRRSVFGECRRIVRLCCPKASKYQICNHQIQIQRAPQPDDIIWQNIDQTDESIFLKQVASVSFGMVLLAVGGMIQYWLAKWQLQTSGFTLKLVSVISSTIVMIINYIIRTFLVWVTDFQRNLTHSKRYRSINLKLCYFEFFNAGVFYTLANVMAASFSEYKLTENFSLNITTFMILNAIQPTLMTCFLDYFEVPKCIHRFLLRRGMRKYSQKEANEIFEHPECSVPDKYSYVIKTVMLACFYTPFVPVVALISLIGIAGYYLAVKLLFRYCYALPTTHSNEINIGAMRLSYLAPLALNAGQMFIHYYIELRLNQTIDIGISIISYTSLAFACLFVFIPWNDVNVHFFPLKTSSPQASYSQMASTFEITYEQADPLNDALKQTRIRQRDLLFAIKQCRDMDAVPQMLKKVSLQLGVGLQSERRLSRAKERES